MGAAVTLYDFNGREIETDNPLPVSLYDSNGVIVSPEDPLPVKVEQGDNLKTTLYDEEGNQVDLVSQTDLLSQIIKQIKITNLHLSMLTNTVIDREDVL